MIESLAGRFDSVLGGVDAVVKAKSTTAG